MALPEFDTDVRAYAGKSFSLFAHGRKNASHILGRRPCCLPANPTSMRKFSESLGTISNKEGLETHSEIYINGFQMWEKMAKYLFDLWSMKKTCFNLVYRAHIHL